MLQLDCDAKDSERLLHANKTKLYMRFDLL